MKKSTKIINNIIVFVVTAALFILIALLNNAFYGYSAWKLILFLVLGAIVSALINALFHEFGHFIVGKKNGFKTVSFCFWIFRWRLSGKKMQFSFNFYGEEAGATETVPTYNENLAVRYKKMTLGGIVTSFILVILSVLPLIFVNSLPQEAFIFLGTFLPISAYYFLGNALPIVSEGVYNDGAVVWGLRKNDNVMKVSLNLLAIHGELYSGKTPAEISEDLYFNLPQLPEDNLTFITLLNARYEYYLDKEDYVNAKKTTDRLLSLSEFMPKSFINIIKANALYDACTFNKNSDKADELTYELEKFLNNDNSLTNIRIKLSYLIYVVKDYSNVQDFYKKGLREVKRCPIKGIGEFERKLLDKMMKDVK